MRSQTNGKVLGDRAQSLLVASRKIMRKGSAEARSFIHREPVLSTLIGVAAGFAVSMIFRPRK